eukprot:jgi/Galph1/2484/GphlegSOOS_G1177.1
MILLWQPLKRLVTVVGRLLTNVYETLRNITFIPFRTFWRKQEDAFTQFCETCDKRPIGPLLLVAFKKALQDSRRCSHILHIIEENKDFDEYFVSKLLQETLTEQARSSVGEQLNETLVQLLKELKHINHIKKNVKQLQVTPFNYENEVHDKTLQKLWSLLLPSVPSENTITKSDEWSKLGFQGKDPTTDLRGGGFLSLQQLVYFAETRTWLACQMVNEARQSYPFACVGIHCTVAIIRLMEENYFDRLFYACSEEQALTILNERYCELLIRFHRNWKGKSWEDLMSFSSHFHEQLQQAKESLLSKGYITETNEE